MGKWHQRQVHHLFTTAGLESEVGQVGDWLPSLRPKCRALAHGLERVEFGIGIHQDEAPPGAWLKNRIPGSTRVF